MNSEHAVDKFRQKYRTDIHPAYNGYLHMAFVVAAGLYFIHYQLSQLQDFHWHYLFGVAVTLVIWNFIEYFVHIKLGHQQQKVAMLFYKRHTGDHHSFFDHIRLVPKNHKDWRVTLFPAWLVLLVGLISWSAGLCLSWLLAKHWGLIFSASLMIGYLGYEFFHFCDHLPKQHPLVKLPWIGHMRHLHKLHHRRDLMHSKNFNLTFPLADWLLGTYYWQAPKECDAEE